jgi:hypothetical protein
MSTRADAMPTAKAKREALLRELRTGRKIPACEMVSIAGLQYNRTVHELRLNVNGCVYRDCPKGLEYGLNIQNDNPNPRHPDHTVFWLAEGHWTKPPRTNSEAGRQVIQQVRAAIECDDAREDHRIVRGPAGSGLLFGELTPDRRYVE